MISNLRGGVRIRPNEDNRTLSPYISVLAYRHFNMRHLNKYYLNIDPLYKIRCDTTFY